MKKIQDGVVKKRSEAKPLRVTLLGGGAAARDLARTLGRWATVSVQSSRSSSSSARSKARAIRTVAPNGEIPRADVIVDMRRGRGKGFEDLVDAITREIERNVERQISDRQSEFVSLTSHELRTPLTSSREAVSLVADGVAGTVNHEQRTYLEMAARNLARLTGVVNQLLDLADVEHGRIVLLPAPVDLSEITRAATERWASRFAEKGVRFEAPRPRSLVVEVDRERVGHVIDALLDNALKFTPAGGFVRLRSRGTARFVELAVEDTGIGIPATARRLIFQKFRQLDPALTRRHGGLGLGLTLTREIVRSHGGRIRVEAREGGGARVVVRLPRSTKGNGKQ